MARERFEGEGQEKNGQGVFGFFLFFGWGFFLVGGGCVGGGGGVWGGGGGGGVFCFLFWFLFWFPPFFFWVGEHPNTCSCVCGAMFFFFFFPPPHPPCVFFARHYMSSAEFTARVMGDASLPLFPCYLSNLEFRTKYVETAPLKKRSSDNLKTLVQAPVFLPPLHVFPGPFNRKVDFIL